MLHSLYIVEDDPDIGFLLDLFLTEGGFNVTLMKSATEFQTKFSDAEPDAFLLDVMLPDGNGIALCEQIKKNRRTAHIPVAIMSAHIPAHEHSLHGNADAFISKPFDLDYVAESLRRLIEKN